MPKLNWKPLKPGSDIPGSTAPVSGVVTVRAAREGEVVNLGQPIVIINRILMTRGFARPFPKQRRVHIALGDQLNTRLPSGDIVTGKVIFKAPEADFATQRGREPSQARH